MEPGINKPINGKTKISFLIKANPLVIETLAGFNPHFKKLKNPVLRNLLAPRVNIEEACKIGKCGLQEFLDKMAEIGFAIDRSATLAETGPSAIPQTYQLTLTHVEAIEMDVRPILAQKQDPLKLIMQNINKLGPGQCLKIINSFEPVPLINMLVKKGFRHQIERPEAELVITYFIKTTDSGQITELPRDDSSGYNNAEFERMLKLCDPAKLHTIDVRELEMPLPMITILEKLKEIRTGELLLVYHKKVPVFLLPELKERGFDFLIRNTPDNTVDILIFRQ
jgi:uncharacterized protein (DUF2249 family)